MKAITCLFQLIPLIIIIASVYFTLAIIRGKVKVKYNTHSKYIYWFMPTLCYLLLGFYSFMYAHYSEELGNGVLGLILIMNVSIITPLCLYGGMLYLEFSRNRNKHRIIWITPICIVLLYSLLFSIPGLNRHGDLNINDVITMIKIMSVLIYFNCIIICPVIAFMIARLKQKNEKNYEKS